MAPGADEEAQGEVFVGPTGQMVRDACQQAGLDPETDVAYLNLARCRPERDDFSTKAWSKAEQRCARFLTHDLGTLGEIPLLVLGTRPAQRLLNDSKLRIGATRGLWYRATTTPPRRAFVARHPGEILRGEERRAELEDQFYGDVQRCADSVLGQTPPSEVTMTYYETPAVAEEFLVRLAKRTGPWVFDIETFDAAGPVARKHVGTDPCHPDFRVHGVAIAWSATHGAYIYLAEWEDYKAQASSLLAPAFASSAEKGAFNGSFDEEGLVYPGWVPVVINRKWDGMLAMVALGDATHDSLRLEKAVVDLLHLPQSWDAIDKSRIRAEDIETVALGSVGDACRTFRLCETLHGMMARGEYL